MPDQPDWDNAVAIPFLISRIKTSSAGGWQIVLDVPQIAENQVKQLIGTENNTMYSGAFLYVQVIAEVKRSPGRPRNEPVEV